MSSGWWPQAGRVWPVIRVVEPERGLGHSCHLGSVAVEGDGRELRAPTSACSGLLGRARRQAHHLPWLDADYKDQV